MFKERLISGLLGCMFILIFQPFGLIAFDHYRWVLIGGICACIFTSILVAECLLSWVFRLPHEPSRGMKYLIKRNFLFQAINIVGMTAGTVVFLDRFCCMEGLDNHLSWSNTFSCFAVYMGCSMIIGLYWRNVYMKRDFQRQLQEAQYLNGILQERQRIEIQKHTQDDLMPSPAQAPAEPETATPRELTLTGSTKESLTLLPQDFIYAESNGNYVHIFFFRDGAVKDIMLRCSITQIEDSLKFHKSILRCHRAFVANLAHVSKLENHGSTLQLYYKASGAFVPVSKTYIQVVKERIVDPQN